MGKKGTPHRKWSAAEKVRIVKRHLEEHVSLRQLEAEEGAGNALIGSWVKRYLSEGVAGLEARMTAFLCVPDALSSTKEWGMEPRNLIFGETVYSFFSERPVPACSLKSLY